MTKQPARPATPETESGWTGQALRLFPNGPLLPRPARSSMARAIEFALSPALPLYFAARASFAFVAKLD